MCRLTGFRGKERKEERKRVASRRRGLEPVTLRVRGRERSKWAGTPILSGGGTEGKRSVPARCLSDETETYLQTSDSGGDRREHPGDDHDWVAPVCEQGARKAGRPHVAEMILEGCSRVPKGRSFRLAATAMELGCERNEAYGDDHTKRIDGKRARGGVEKDAVLTAGLLVKGTGSGTTAT